MTDERRRPAKTEREVLAALCAALPALRERAEAGFWADTLDMHVAEVIGGESAVVACEQLDLTFDHDDTEGADPDTPRSVRSDDAVADLWPAPSLVGDYHCPLRRCGRRDSRDDLGRPPRCWLTDEQMRFSTRGA